MHAKFDAIAKKDVDFSELIEEIEDEKKFW